MELSNSCSSDVFNFLRIPLSARGRLGFVGRPGETVPVPIALDSIILFLFSLSGFSRIGPVGFNKIECSRSV